MDALVGSGLQYAQPPIRMSELHFAYQLHDERICNENLWRLYKMAPCRSFVSNYLVLNYVCVCVLVEAARLCTETRMEQ